jgi:flavin reductase (DIM6/NTAB) family NADH-FMN oxidoreductase RutF
MVCVCAGAELVELGCVEILVDESDALAFGVATASALNMLICAKHVGSCMNRLAKSNCSQNDGLEVDVYMMNGASSQIKCRWKNSQEIQTLRTEQYFVLHIKSSLPVALQTDRRREESALETRPR